ncbi:hypothetical protein [Paractinoplanes atraurantiacus]|uniref:Flavin reductase n=1 Tax=Paractinoplanes atraurantiacus TaxID=1036182 RepID=A0A285H077_9ACTN|nr:hypothetical protein [Actinoplanes atraurantiacus]SNY29157.1 hypothetical protein SAMN05421748_103201 [Actinoplanes atraurantiacus]
MDVVDRQPNLIRHLPNRPGWNCIACTEPWPCEVARVEVPLAMPDPIQLAMFLWGYLEEFLLEHQTGAFGEAHERFLAWSR